MQNWQGTKSGYRTKWNTREPEVVIYKTFRDFQVGDEFNFWSERVFGVPAYAKVTKVDRKNGKLYIKACYGGTWWKGRIHPDRIVDPI